MNGYGSEYGVSYRTLHRIFESLYIKKAKAEEIAAKTNKSNNSNNKNSNNNVDNSNGNSGKDDDDEEDASPFSYSVEVSMMEIYNDQVHDLLIEGGNDFTGGGGGNNSSSGGGREGGLDIRQSPDGSVSVPGLKQIKVHKIEDVMEVFARGSANRATATTNLNEHSSRSHSILLVDVTTCTSGAAPVKSKLYLVDLAGSERVGKSGVTGAAMKEAQHINKSLSALGDVMEALDQKSKHVPYRLDIFIILIISFLFLFFIPHIFPSPLLYH